MTYFRNASFSDKPFRQLGAFGARRTGNTLTSNTLTSVPERLTRFVEGNPHQLRTEKSFGSIKIAGAVGVSNRPVATSSPLESLRQKAILCPLNTLSSPSAVAHESSGSVVRSIASGIVQPANESDRASVAGLVIDMEYLWWLRRIRA
jgi:hypothetical protein